jgi:hypothetical protein
MSTSTQQRKRAAVAVSAGAVLAVSALAAEPAGAETFTKTKGYCTGNTLCEFSDGGFTNNFARWVFNTPPVDIDDYSKWNYEVTFLDSEKNLGDSISSIWNNSNRWVVLFQKDHQRGNHICFPPGTAVNDLHTVQMTGGWVIRSGGTNWGNQISSHRIYGGSTPGFCNPGSDGTIVPANQYGCSM